MLDLEFSAEQEMLRDTVRKVCATYSPMSVVRELEDDPVGYPVELWKQLGELDLIGLLLPEEHGGSGMTVLEGVVLYEELGRSLAPTPHFASAVLCGGALALAGSAEQQARWLPGVARGEVVLTPAWFEPENSCAPAGIEMRAVPDGDGFRLDGTKRHVPFASSAAALLVLARTGDAPGDVDLFLVDTGTAGVSLHQQLSVASDTQYQVTLDAVRVGTDRRIGAAGTGWATWDAVMHDGCILLAAQAMGGAQQALDITVQYAKDRQQFDKPLGAFQALAHYLADAVTAVDGGTTLVHEAAWARAEGRPVASLAPMAKLFACRTFRDLTAMAQQLFGGIGFTVDFDIQLYFRRAKQLQLSWWDTRYLEELVASAVLDRRALTPKRPSRVSGTRRPVLGSGARRPVLRRGSRDRGCSPPGRCRPRPSSGSGPPTGGTGGSGSAPPGGRARGRPRRRGPTPARPAAGRRCGSRPSATYRSPTAGSGWRPTGSTRAGPPRGRDRRAWRPAARGRGPRR